MTIYDVVQNGDYIDVDTEENPLVKMACCDCGLTHLMTFIMVKGKKIRVRIYRDEPATGQVRRWMKKKGEGIFGDES